MKQKQSESGRSMVEMLAVLVVIGVLSIGGIVGYRAVMRQYKANEIWNDVMLRAQVIRAIPNYDANTNEINMRDVNLSALGIIGKSGYEIQGKLRGMNSAGAFIIYVLDVPEDICNQVVKMRPDDEHNIVAIWPNGQWQKSSICETGKNKMAFIFDFPRPCFQRCLAWYKSYKKSCENSRDGWCGENSGFWCQQGVAGTCVSGNPKFNCNSAITTLTGERHYAHWTGCFE